MSKPPKKHHFRQTFLAGVFAAAPIAGTIFLVVWIDNSTRFISEKLIGRHIPLIGVIVAVVAIYLVGLVARSLLGRYLFRIVDSMLVRIPGLKELYTAWKQISLNPDGSEGTFTKVVLIPAEAGEGAMTIGFTSGLPIPGDPDRYCVFVPAAPNPINGRLIFVHRDKCRFLDVAVEEAFKTLLSTGNYVPAEVGAMTTNKLAGCAN